MESRMRRMVCAATVTAAISPAWSQQAFTKPVTVVVGFAAGGPADQLARMLAPKLGAALGTTVLVDNRTGANGSLAMAHLSRAKPDGYTIGLATAGQGVINLLLLPDGGGVDTAKDLTFLGPVVRYENILLVNAALPVKTLAEFIAYAKTNPGRVSYGSGGNGASNHLSGVLLEMATGVKLNHIPYRGSGPALTDLMAGNISSMFDVLATAMPQVQAGRVRALAVTGAKRNRYVPDTPTFEEAGVPEFERLSGTLWYGMFAPPGMQPEALAMLRAVLSKIMEDSEVKAKITDLKYEPWHLNPSDYSEFHRNELAKWGAALKAAGVKAQ